MKCHLCVNHIELQTDPAGCDYVIVSGARRKEERWDQGDNGQLLPTGGSCPTTAPPPRDPRASLWGAGGGGWGAETHRERPTAPLVAWVGGREEVESGGVGLGGSWQVQLSWEGPGRSS